MKTRFSPSRCCCGCVATFQSRAGASDAELNLRPPAMTIQVWRDATKTESLGSGSVDANGLIQINVGRTGDVYYEASAPRYKNTVGTVNVPACGAVVPVYLPVHDDYVGVAVAASNINCRYPIPKTMHFSASGGDSGTIDYQGTSGGLHRWAMTTPSSFPGSGGLNTCPAGTVNVRYLLDFSPPEATPANVPVMTRVVPLKVTRLTSPPFSVISSCPDSTGAEGAAGPMTLDSPTFSCDPLYLRFSPSFTPTAYPWADQTLTVTE